MLGLANVYTCGTCGDVTDVYLYEHIDFENDEIYPVMHCGKCNRDVSEKTVEVDGRRVPVMAEVDDDFYAYGGGDDDA